MPHHSKHQRPPVSGSFSRQSSGGNAATSQSPHYFRRTLMPPPGISASMSMPPGTKSATGEPPSPLHHHTLGLHHNHSWMSLPPYASPHQQPVQQQPTMQHHFHQPSHQQQGIHRMPITPLKEDDASKVSRVHQSHSLSSSSREGSPPTILKKHERTKSFESHEIAASVLLLASSIRDNERQTTGKSNEGGDESDDNGSTQFADSSRPLKKRKNVTEINVNEHTFHVSPMSGKSSPSDPGLESSTSNTPTSAYDTREHENLLVKPSPILPTFKSTIADFPLLLHSVLSDAEFENNVMKWLPDGKFWKIIRWDALRRQVMPKYFPSIDSIDIFLLHLQSWGFNEITEGPDAGAYSHMVRFSHFISYSFS
jgi:HSF-type DNA-binding